MAGEEALDGEVEPVTLDDGAIDDAVGDLRSVLKKDAGEEPVFNEESVDSMGGAPAFGSDFGADFPDSNEPDGSDDPFQIGEPAAAAGTGFGGDFGGADDISSDFGGAGSFGGSGGAAPGQDFGTPAGSQGGARLGASGETSRLDLVLGIPVDVQIILGSSRMAVSTLMNLAEGATIALDRKIGEPVEIMVNGRLIGRGEITVLESDDTRFAIRIIEVIGAPQKKSN